jgi:phosphoesterase RecJ-like protein
LKIADILKDRKKIGIAGHVRPDGDCVGSCMGLYNYILDNFKDIEVHVYLEDTLDKFNYIANIEKAEKIVTDKDFDLFISLDLGDIERLAVAKEAFLNTENTICIDHHTTSKRFAKVNHVISGISSTSEILYSMMEEEKISLNTATALYTGIIHDTGVFKYESTTEKTMNIAGKLMSKGVDFPTIIDSGFYEKSYLQNQILGRAMLESILILDGKCIFSVIRKDEMEFFGLSPADLGGIVEQLRLTEKVECAIFLYEIEPLEYKVSLRSKKIVDVNQIAAYFGGGGHIRAAGCTMKGTVHDAVNNITKHIEKQLLKLN